MVKEFQSKAEHTFPYDEAYIHGRIGIVTTSFARLCHGIARLVSLPLFAHLYAFAASLIPAIEPQRGQAYGMETAYNGMGIPHKDMGVSHKGMGVSHKDMGVSHKDMKVVYKDLKMGYTAIEGIPKDRGTAHNDRGGFYVASERL
ncbi:MAG: hypothetical protein LBP19_09055 [Treponema sp.]|jgi:hypothetical protein|nr:hypothetical protein [Treponema sp.]